MASVAQWKSKTAEAALEQALIAPYGTLGRVPAPFLLRSDNGPELVSEALQGWARRHYVELAFIQPGKPMQKDYAAYCTS